MSNNRAETVDVFLSVALDVRTKVLARGLSQEKEKVMSACRSCAVVKRMGDGRTYDVVNETNSDTGRPDTSVEVTVFVHDLTTCTGNELSDFLEFGTLRTVLEANDFH